MFILWRVNLINNTMKLHVGIAIFAIILVFSGCFSSKTNVSTVNDKALEELVKTKSFEITSEWAQPHITSGMNSIANTGLLPTGSSISNISLIGNSNYLRINKDSVSGYLPYYGERQMGGRYGSISTAIQFDGIPKDYEIKKGKKEGYEIQFSIADKNNPTENYKVYIQLFQSLSSSININSSHRFFIRYKGRVAKIEKSN